MGYSVLSCDHCGEGFIDEHEEYKTFNIDGYIGRKNENGYMSCSSCREEVEAMLSLIEIPPFIVFAMPIDEKSEKPRIIIRDIEKLPEDNSAWNGYKFGIFDRKSQGGDNVIIDEVIVNSFINTRAGILMFLMTTKHYCVSWL